MNDESLIEAGRCGGKRPRTSESTTAATASKNPAVSDTLNIDDDQGLRLVHSADDAVGSSETGEDEPSAKIPCRRHRRRTSSPSTLLATTNTSLVKPTRIAPRWADYIAQGGIQRYLPRPEWCRPTSVTVVNNDKEPVPNSRQQQSNVVPNHGDRLARERQQDDEEFVAPEINGARFQAQQAPADGLLPDDAFVEFLSRRMDASISEIGDRSTAVIEASGLATSSSFSSPNPERDPVDLQRKPSEKSDEKPSPQLPQRQCTFGKLGDTALLTAIREGATEAALDLLHHGAQIQGCNSKGVTPLILAAQLGNLAVIKDLLHRSASPWTASFNGTTPLLQAAHFGHYHIVQTLLDHGAPIEKSNLHRTNSLMRASQEGHFEICRLLLQRGAKVNRQNRDLLSPLMLASQRGHAQVCQLLLDHGADADCATREDSTSLLLACKRGHVQVVRVLVENGCELFIRDSRGRTIRQMVARQLQLVNRQLQSSRNHQPIQTGTQLTESPEELLQNLQEIEKLLNPVMQVHLMRLATRKVRNHTMIRLWTLIQQERAQVPLEDDETAPLHEALEMLDRNEFPAYIAPSAAALLRTMALPDPLLQLVSEYMPLPQLWNRRIGLLNKRSSVDPTATVACTLDLIDEILHEGGFAGACDAAKVTPPTHYSSWVSSCGVNHSL